MNIFNEALFTACACPSDGYVSPRPIPLEAPVTMATGCGVVFIVVFLVLADVVKVKERSF